MKFHKRIAAARQIHEFDSRPGALDRARRRSPPPSGPSSPADSVPTPVPTASPGRRQGPPFGVGAAALEGGRRRVRPPDPLPLDVRHPAEVVGSRTTYYATGAEDVERLRYETFSLSRWLNSSLLSERETRGHPRTFVPYTDLLVDWRRCTVALAGAGPHARQRPQAPGAHHPVDDFIDPDPPPSPGHLGRARRARRPPRALPGGLGRADAPRPCASPGWTRRGDRSGSRRDGRAVGDDVRHRHRGLRTTPSRSPGSPVDGRAAEEVRAEVAERRRRAASKAGATASCGQPAGRPVQKTAATPDRLVRDVTSAIAAAAHGGPGRVKGRLRLKCG